MRPPPGCGSDRELVGAVHLCGATERQLRLPVASDVGGDDRRAVVERTVDRVGSRRRGRRLVAEAATGVSAWWTSVIFASASNRKVSVAVPRTEPGGSVAATVIASPSMTGSDHVATASIGCILATDSSIASRPLPAERAIERHVICKDRSQGSSASAAPARDGVEVAPHGLFRFRHRCRLRRQYARSCPILPKSCSRPRPPATRSRCGESSRNHRNSATSPTPWGRTHSISRPSSTTRTSPG